MTAKTDYAGILELALDMVPMLSDEKHPQYFIKADDEPETIAAKVFDAFLYGLSDSQFQTLEASASRSPARAKQLARINQWLNDVTEILDEPLSPKDLSPYEDMFSDFPNDPDNAGEDEDVLLTSWALIILADAERLPSALDKRVEKLLPMCFPDATVVLKSTASEQAQEPVIEEAPAKTKAEELVEDSALPLEEAQQLVDAYDIEDSIDVPLTPEAAAAGAQEEVPAVKEAPAVEEAAPKATKAPAKDKAPAKAKDKAPAKTKAKAKAEAAPEEAASEEAAPAQLTAPEAAAPAAQTQAVTTPKLATSPVEAPADAPAKRNRSLRRTGGGGQGVMSDIRRLVIVDTDVPFATVERAMHAKGVDCKKSTWSPKLSDMRNMLNYLRNLGLIDEQRLEELSTLTALAEFDEDLNMDQAVAMDAVLASARDDS